MAFYDGFSSHRTVGPQLTKLDFGFQNTRRIDDDYGLMFIAPKPPPIMPGPVTPPGLPMNPAFGPNPPGMPGM